MSVPLNTRLWRYGRWSVLYSPRTLAINAILASLIVLSATLVMTLGKMHISPADVLAALLGKGEGGLRDHIILNIRLPRVLTALFVGVALGISGAVFQSVSRNALGSPDVIGFTTGAATGALAQIMLSGQDPLRIAMAAVVGGVVTAVVVYTLARQGGMVGSYRLILTGIGVGAVLAALNGLMLVRGNLDDAVIANLWLAGSLHARTWAHAWPVMIGTILLLPVILAGASALKMIEMGDDIASQLGIRVERVRLGMIFAAVVLASLAVGAAGPIAFIALAAPQLAARLCQGTGLPILSAGLMGGFLLLAADLLTQLLPLAVSVPIGRMTGIVGGIYLIWLLTRSRQL
ncbi:Fe(3+)-siderophore ABC transporter permease [Ectothiorhodospira shaposhnikovii]|uniref:FecCD family ABC transporter permease n=1 Tax=Ectothiorhodospira shaposhnikovii TaxID=1054 RepID=UPI001908FE45|nr:iron chelate uptake ABC transporter family permease subunit [Ectothiorhodospira shaposhnikovii]MBK1674589.1 Fe(3+)-siderophore ABC transporter permease [Ectothiorhodospira shaposhnikovii]